MNYDIPAPVSPRWLHALAVLTVLLTLPLLFLGAGVTSHDVGMVDPRGFRPPWDIVNGLLENNGLGWRLEYGHRTFGFLVGLCGIGLAIGCWFFDKRPWMGWFGFLALTMICAQGALGIFRVDYNALHGRTFALIHGVFAQLVFVTLVCVAVLTSRRWMAASAGVAPEGAFATTADIAAMPGERHEAIAPALKRCSLVTMLMVFGQLVLGGLVRHKDSLIGPRGHLLAAFLVVGAVVWLLKLIRDSEAGASFKWERIGLMVLLALQLWLGVESWLAKFFVPTVDLPQLAPMPTHAEWIRTAHYLCGTLIFATTATVALVAHRKAIAVAATAVVSPRRLEGAL
jgi:heme A synthase